MCQVLGGAERWVWFVFIFILFWYTPERFILWTGRLRRTRLIISASQQDGAHLEEKNDGRGKDKSKEPSDKLLKNAIVQVLKRVHFNNTVKAAEPFPSIVAASKTLAAVSFGLRGDHRDVLHLTTIILQKSLNINYTPTLSFHVTTPSRSYQEIFFLFFFFFSFCRRLSGNLILHNN